jgi:hypothetical protein
MRSKWRMRGRCKARRAVRGRKRALMRARARGGPIPKGRRRGQITPQTPAAAPPVADSQEDDP